MSPKTNPVTDLGSLPVKSLRVRPGNTDCIVGWKICGFIVSTKIAAQARGHETTSATIATLFISEHQLERGLLIRLTFFGRENEGRNVITDDGTQLATGQVRPHWNGDDCGEPERMLLCKRGNFTVKKQKRKGSQIEAGITEREKTKSQISTMCIVVLSKRDKNLRRMPEISM